MDEGAETESDLTAALRRKKRNALLALLAVSAVAGALDSICANSGTDPIVATIATTVPALLLILHWCMLDSQELRVRISTALAVVILLLALVGVPVYLLKSRGAGGLVAIVAALAVGIVLTLIYNGAATLTWRLIANE